MSAAAKVQYFEKIENRSHKEFVQSHEHCVLCSNALELKHIRNEEEAKIKEEAYCVECDVKARAKIHTLN